VFTESIARRLDDLPDALAPSDLLSIDLASATR
jgi:hypothetical protein